MVLFLNVLQICAIASVFNKVHGYVYLAANIDDFRSIASKFLPENIARKLLDLVVQSSATNTAVGRQHDDQNTAPETSISKITDELKDKLNNEFNNAPQHSKEQTTIVYGNKRYKTISHVDQDDTKTLKKILRQIESKIKTVDSVSVREEYDNRMKQYIEDYSYNDDNKKYETNSKVPFDEFREERGEVDARGIQNTDKKYDFTDTKLGEWKFNQKSSQKPVKIKNVITGYTDIGINSEMVNDAINTHIIDSEYNAERNKYLSRINKHVGEEQYKTDTEYPREIINDKLHDSHLLESTSKVKTKIINENMYIKNSRESKNKYNSHIRPNDRQVKVHETYNNHVFVTQETDVHKRKPSAYLRETKYIHAKHELDSNKRSTVKHQDSFIRKPPKQLIRKPIMYEKSELDSKAEKNKERNGLKRHDSNEKEHKWQLMEKNDESNNYDLGSKTKDSIELYKGKRKRKPSKTQINKDEEHDTDKSYTKTEISKDPKAYMHKDNNERRPWKKVVDTNDIYDKYILGSKMEDSKEQKLSEHKDSYKTKYKKQPIEENDRYDKNILGSKSKTAGSEQQKLTDHKDNYVIKHKKQPITKNYMNNKHPLGSKPEQSKSKYINKTTHLLQINGNRKDQKRKPHKNPIEQNDMYDKFILGSKTEASNESKVSSHRDIHKRKRPWRPTVGNEKYKLGKTKKRKHMKHRPYNNNHGFGNHSRLRNKQRDPLDNEYKKGKNSVSVDEVTTENVPTTTALPGFVDDPLPDFKEVKAGAIKARTESLLDDDNESFMMNGTDIPTRKVFKMSSPDYYGKLPRIVDKYDFNEPLPEKDRSREKIQYIKREPSLVNRKIKLPIFDSV